LEVYVKFRESREIYIFTGWLSAEGGVTDLVGWIQVGKVGEASVCLQYLDSTVSCWYIHCDSVKIHVLSFTGKCCTLASFNVVLHV
jgi:hypothetical protein